MNAGPFEWPGLSKDEKTRLYLEGESFTVTLDGAQRTVSYTDITAVYYKLDGLPGMITMYFLIEVAGQDSVDLTCEEYNSYRDQCIAGANAFFEYYGRAVPDAGVYNEMKMTKGAFMIAMIIVALIFVGVMVFAITPEQFEGIMRGEWEVLLSYAIIILTMLIIGWMAHRKFMKPERRSIEYMLGSNTPRNTH